MTAQLSRPLDPVIGARLFDKSGQLWRVDGRGLHVDEYRLVTPGRRLTRFEVLREGRFATFDFDTNWSKTISGRRFYFFDPEPDDIFIEDIAAGLAKECRFNGQCRGHYSVAQHSVLVSRMVPAEHALWGLLHDASEAYLRDIIRPIKRHSHMAPYRSFEREIMLAICARFGLPLAEPDCVREADARMLATEKRDLTAPWLPGEDAGAQPYPDEIVPLSPEQAERVFLDRFDELTQATLALASGDR